MSHLRRFMFGVAFACALAAITALIAWLGSIGNAIMLVLCGLVGVFGMYVAGECIERELIYHGYLPPPARSASEADVIVDLLKKAEAK